MRRRNASLCHSEPTTASCNRCSCRTLNTPPSMPSGSGKEEYRVRMSVTA